MTKEIELFTAENRPVCKRCEDRKAVLNKGKLAYNGFCSSCYQRDKTERRAAEALNPTVKVAKQPRTPRDPAEPKEPKAKAVPGGHGKPKPSEQPGPDDEVLMLPTVFGWCLTGHHVGMTEDDLYPDGKTGLLTGSISMLCPGIIWLCLQGHWLSCPCSCHDKESFTAASRLQAHTSRV